MEEQWKWVQGYEELYQISNFGRVRSQRNKNKPNFIMKEGWIRGSQGTRYPAYMFSVNGVKQTFTASRLVAQAFIPNPNNHQQVGHKDFDRYNNRVDNLFWTNGENNVRRYYGTLWVATHPDTGERTEAHSRRHLAKLLGVSYGQIIYRLKHPDKPLKTGQYLTIEKTK